MTDREQKRSADWAELLNTFESRHADARAMGGHDKLRQRAEQGQCNAREIIDQLVDAGSFLELGALVGGIGWHGEAPVPADALVAGMARINRRHVLVGAEDFTVKGGSIGHGTSAKRLRLARLAGQEKVPLIMILDGAGARASNGVARYPYAPTDLQELAELSGRVPTIAFVLGSSAGHGAIGGLMMDFVVMTEQATLFSAGPPLVAAALGEEVTKEGLGAASIHARISGVAHNIVADGRAGCQLIRDYLDYLPSNAHGYPPKAHDAPDRERRQLSEILHVVPRNAQQSYDMMAVIDMMLDERSRLELQPDFGKAIIVSLGRLGGHPLLVVANQPRVMAGAIDHCAANKTAHWLEFADAWHLPVLFLADNPGIMSGSKAEQAGTLRAAARMYQAQARLASPKLHVTLRKAFGFGSSLMAMNPFDNQTLTLAFPGITLGGLPAQGGAAAAKLDDNAQSRMREAENNGAWIAGDNMAYDAIIDPRELRNALLDGLQLALNRRNAQPVPRKVGIRP